MSCKILLVEKVNHSFRKMTGSRQASGLSVCVQMIANNIPGVQLVEVDSAEHAMNSIQFLKPKKVIFEALWLTEQDMKKLRLRFPDLEFFLHIHSNIPFLACEGSALTTIMIAHANGFGLIFNDHRASEAFSKYNAYYLPNVYVVSNPPERTKKDNPWLINIMCAGSLRPMKNHLTQAFAAISYADARDKNLVFYIQDRVEGGSEILANLNALFRMHPRHTLMKIPWMDHHSFLKFLAQEIDIGMQVSMSETFNLVCADYVTAGVPFVCSGEVSWTYNRVGDVGYFSEIHDFMDACDSRESIEMNKHGLWSSSSRAIRKWNDFANS